LNPAAFGVQFSGAGQSAVAKALADKEDLENMCFCETNPNCILEKMDGISWMAMGSGNLGGISIRVRFLEFRRFAVS
jgi:hypothetical protein